MSETARAPFARRTRSAIALTLSVGGVFAGVFGGAEGVAEARPTRFRRAVSQEAAREERAILEAEQDLLREKMLRAQRRPDPLQSSLMYLRRAELTLSTVMAREAAGAEPSLKPEPSDHGATEQDAKREGDPYVRVLWVRIASALEKWQEAYDVASPMLKDFELPEVFRGDLASDVAQAAGRIGARERELEAYDQAILMDPVVATRSIMCANRAESLMAMGDLQGAILGYEEAIRLLLSLEPRAVPYYAPTTFWSLGVARDRQGDLRSALAAIGDARSYDPTDRAIHADGWAFLPPYEEHYYDALGSWQTARASEDLEVKVVAYERSRAAWDRYLAEAPKEGPYVAIAQARRRQLEREAQPVWKKARTPTKIDPSLP